MTVLNFGRINTLAARVFMTTEGQLSDVKTGLASICDLQPRPLEMMPNAAGAWVFTIDHRLKLP